MLARLRRSGDGADLKDADRSGEADAMGQDVFRAAEGCRTRGEIRT